jgi:hypothetical protein
LPFFFTLPCVFGFFLLGFSLADFGAAGAFCVFF